MADPIHVTRLTPNNNVVKWMERKEKALLDNHESSDDSRCFLIRHSFKYKSERRKHFPKSVIWSLSPASFLTKLSKLSLIHYQWKRTDTVFRCEYLDIVPDIMYDYESGRLKNNADLNDNQVHERDKDVWESNAKRVANVVVVRLDTEGSRNMKENEAFEDCCICLTRKRKEVLLSLTKQYF